MRFKVTVSAIVDVEAPALVSAALTRTMLHSAIMAKLDDACSSRPIQVLPGVSVTVLDGEAAIVNA